METENNKFEKIRKKIKISNLKKIIKSKYING